MLTEKDLEPLLKDYEDQEKAVMVKGAAKAYVQGDLKAQKALGMKSSFNLVNKEAVKFLPKYKDDLERGGSYIQGKWVPWLQDKTLEERRQIAKILEEGYKAGKQTGVKQYKKGGKYGLYPKDSIAGDLQGFFDKRRSHAATVARTEIARVQIQGSINRYRIQGIKKVMWLVFEPCEICEQYARRVYDLGNLPREIPVHPNCFLPGTLYKAPGLVSGLRAFYSGQAVEITAANGASVTVTENHLILTAAGFARANQLRKGDYIVYSPDFEREITNDPDDYKIPARVEDIFNALIKAGGGAAGSVPAAPEYLHGDGQAVQGNIDIIRPYGFLRSAGEAPGFEHTNTDFLDSGSPGGGLITLGAFTEVLKSLARAADGGLGGGRQAALFFGRRMGHTVKHGLGAIPGSYPGFLEAADDGAAVTAKNISECLNRSPGVIQFQEITNINIFPYHGLVYDFETISSLSIGNGFITSNCRCALAPVPDEVPTGPAPQQKIPEVFEKEGPALPPKIPGPEEIRAQIPEALARIEGDILKLSDEMLEIQKKADELTDKYFELKRPWTNKLLKNQITTAEYDAFEKTLKPLEDELAALHDIKTAKMRARGLLMENKKESIRELMYINDGAPKGFYRKYMGFDLDGRPSILAKKSEDFLNKVMSEKMRDRVPRLAIESVPDRSWTDTDNIIRLSTKRDEETLIHETGHNIEFKSPGFHKAAQEFLERRTAGETAQKLRDLTGGNYDDWEVTKPDKFINPYVGKIYPDKYTEVISMGLQWLYADPAMLAEKDPELFDLIINGIRGYYDS